MPRPAHPDAMQPSRPGRTRTAAPVMPPRFPSGGRYRSYIAFGGSAFFFLAMSLLVLRAVWALGSGEPQWRAQLEDYAHPLYVAFHALAAGVFVWCGWRFLIQLFPKSQPPRIGPFPRPPVAVFPPLLGAVWLGTTAITVAVLWGVVL